MVLTPSIQPDGCFWKAQVCGASGPNITKTPLYTIDDLEKQGLPTPSPILIERLVAGLRCQALIRLCFAEEPDGISPLPLRRA